MTEREVLVLETVIRSGLIEPILERLVQLNYVSRTGARYQGIARPGGP